MRSRSPYFSGSLPTGFHRSRPGLLAICSLTFLIAACDGSGAHKSAKIDACSLIDAAQASKIFGTTLTSKPVDTSAAGPDAGSLCHYNSGTVHGGFTLGVGHLNAHGSMHDEAAEQKKSIVDDFKTNAGLTPTVSDIPDLGEAAYLVNITGSLQLHVLSKGYGIVVVRSVSKTPQAVAQTEAVARVVLKNLK